MRLLVEALPLLAAVAVVGLTFVRQQEADAQRSDAYQAAVRLEASGDLLGAIDLFGEAEGYRDAISRQATLQMALEPYAAAYVDGSEALARGDYQTAISLLLPVARDLPAYLETRLLLEQAREARATELQLAAAQAEALGDWLAVERALAEWRTLAPEHPDIEERLTSVRQERSPMVLTSGRDVRLYDPVTGESSALAEDVEALWAFWSPDRERIAFVSPVDNGRPLDGTLYVMDADGSAPVPLAERVLPRNNWPSWSPDGTKIAFTSFAQYDEYTETGVIGVHLVDLVAGEEINLTGDILDHAHSATWAPDSQRLAFVSREYERSPEGSMELADGDVFVLDLRDGSLTNVTNGRITEEWRVAWSPTDDRLLITTLPGDWTDPQESELFLLDLPSDQLLRVPTHAWEIGAPFWSPDGTRFAYVEGNDIVRIWSAEGEEWVRLPTGIEPYLSWSADGEMIVAPGNDGRGPSYLLPLDERFGEANPFYLTYDSGRGESGPPVLTARVDLPGAETTDFSGSALDPGADYDRDLIGVLP